MIPEEKDLAYFAGFIDGEGYIGISRMAQRKAVSPQWRVQVSASNTDPRVISQLKECFGGHFNLCHKRKFGNDRPVFQWCVISKQASIFLQAIRPYLKMKRDQADIAISFQKTLTSSGRKLTDEQIAWRQIEVDKIRTLNGYGLTKGRKWTGNEKVA